MGLIMSKIGLVTRKPVLGGLLTTKAQTSLCIRSLISAFVIRVLESTIYNLATSENLILQLVSVAEETGLKLALSETLKTGFLATRPKYANNKGKDKPGHLCSLVNVFIILLN